MQGNTVRELGYKAMEYLWKHRATGWEGFPDRHSNSAK